MMQQWTRSQSLIQQDPTKHYNTMNTRRNTLKTTILSGLASILPFQFLKASNPSDLINVNGQAMTFPQFVKKHAIKISPDQYSVLLKFNNNEQIRVTGAVKYIWNIKSTPIGLITMLNKDNPPIVISR